MPLPPLVLNVTKNTLVSPLRDIVLQGAMNTSTSQFHIAYHKIELHNEYQHQILNINVEYKNEIINVIIKYSISKLDIRMK